MKVFELVCAVVISLAITTGIAAIQPQIAQVSDANSQENNTEESAGQESTTTQTTASQIVGEPTFARESAKATDLTPNVASDSPVAKTLSGHQGIVYCVTFSPDGKILASGDENGAANLWQAATGKKVSTFITPKHRDNPDEKILIRSLAFSPDGTTLATGNTGSSTFGMIRLWDVTSGKNVATFDGSDPERILRGIYSLAFSPDGKTLASGHEDNLIRIWNASSGNILTTFEADADDTVYTVAYSPKGETLASAGPKGIIKLWDVARSEITATFKAGGSGFIAGGLATPVFSLTFSSDGRTLGAGCWSKGGLLWDVAGGHAAKFGGKKMPYSVAFSPDGKMFAMGCDNGEIELWDTTSRKRMAILTGHTALVRSLDFHPDGKTLASSSDDSSVKLWTLD